MANKLNKKPRDDSEMGNLIRDKNWAETHLGPIEEWPQTLSTIVNVVTAASNPMCIIWGDEYTCIYNDAFLKALQPDNHPQTLGKPGSEVFGDTWKAIHPQIKKVFAGEEAVASENLLITNSQNTETEDQYWTFNYSPVISDVKESIEGALVICTNTTASVTASTKLKESEEWTKHIINSVKEYAIITLNAERRITSWNDGATRLLGYERNEILGESGDIFFTLEDQKKNKPEKEALEARKTGRAEDKRWHLRKDGTCFWGSGVMLPLTESSDEGFVKIFRDRTQERKAEKELEASEHKYRSLFNSINEGFCIIEKVETPEGEKSDYRYVETNPAFDEQAGVSDVRGKTIREVLPKIEESWIDLYDKVLKERTAETVENFVKETGRHLELNAFPLDKREKNRLAVLFIDITERKKTEHFLKKSEERALFFNSLNDEFRWLSDPISIQEEAIRMLGEHLGVNRVSFGEIENNETVVVERHYINGVKKSRRKQNLNDFSPELLSTLQSGKTMVVENYVEDLDLDEKQVALFDKDKVCAFVAVPLIKRGHFIAILNVQHSTEREWSAEEISLIEETAERTWSAVERARTERLLRQSEKKYRSLFNSIDEGFCILEKVPGKGDEPSDFKFVEVNAAFERQAGVENPIGKTIRDVTDTFDESVYEYHDQVLKTGKSKRFEVTIKNPKRILSLYAFVNDEAKKNRIAVIFNNITEQRRIEEDLRKSGERLKAALNGTEVGVWDLNFTKNTTWRSQKHDQIFGYENQRSKWNYDIFLEHVVPEDREQVDEKLKRALETDGKWDFECRIQRVDGEQRWISVRGRVLNESGKSNRRLVGTLQDITERKKNEEKLESINETLEERVRERTAALLSYQNQLRSLASQLSKTEELERHRLAEDLHDNLGQLLAMSKIELGLLEDYVSEEASVDQLSDLINQAITYTRELMSDLKPPPSLDEEDLIESIEWTADKMKKRGLDISINDDEHHKPVSNEVRAALVQAVREALFNVVKHANVKTAEINILKNDDRVLVSVVDKGEGFDTDNLKIGVDDESGFGLFNIQERLDLLGGEVKVKSEPGEGTTVDIYAPLLEPEEEELMKEEDEQTLEETVSYENTGIIRVLLVDDHQMMLKGLRKIVEQEENLQVIAEATNGKEAVELALDLSPDIIVMDVDMPVMNGIDATKEIMANMENVRIIGLSLHEKGSVADAMRDAGATAYLTKTEAFEALSATIRSEAVLAKK